MAEMQQSQHFPTCRFCAQVDGLKNYVLRVGENAPEDIKLCDDCALVVRMRLSK